MTRSHHHILHLLLAYLECSHEQQTSLEKFWKEIICTLIVLLANASSYIGSEWLASFFKSGESSAKKCGSWRLKSFIVRRCVLPSAPLELEEIQLFSQMGLLHAYFYPQRRGRLLQKRNLLPSSPPLPSVNVWHMLCNFAKKMARFSPKIIRFPLWCTTYFLRCKAESHTQKDLFSVSTGLKKRLMQVRTTLDTKKLKMCRKVNEAMRMILGKTPRSTLDEF